MKNIFLTFFTLFFLLLPLQGFGKEPLRTEDSVVIRDGAVVETGIMADSVGEVFLEFSKDTRALYEGDRISYEGEILPPQIISLPERPPRPRMQEILTFELLADVSDQILFADKFDIMNSRSTLRSQLLDPENFQRTAFVRVFAPLDSEINLPRLWQYRLDRGWVRLGGRQEDSSDPSIQVFSSNIKSTGIYTIFDEDPSVSFIPAFPLDEIELALEAPFPASGLENESIQVDNEITSPSTQDIFGEEEIIPETEVSLGIPPVLVDGEDVSIGTTIPGLDEQGNEILPVENPLEPPSTTPETFASETAPPIESSPTGEYFEESNTEEEGTIPEGSILPQSGPEPNGDEGGEGDASPTQKFPFMILFALVILGASSYFVIGDQKHS